MAGAGGNYGESSSQQSTKMYRDLLQSAIGNSQDRYAGLVGQSLISDLNAISGIESSMIGQAGVRDAQALGGLAPGTVSTAGAQTGLAILPQILSAQQAASQRNTGLQSQSIESWLNSLKALAALSGKSSSMQVGASYQSR